MHTPRQRVTCDHKLPSANFWTPTASVTFCLLEDSLTFTENGLTTVVSGLASYS